MKRSGFKRKGVKSSKIRQSARGEDCTLNIDGVCSYDPATVVLAHSNRYEDGKGMGLKSDDAKGCYACYQCHMWLDHGWAQTNATKEEMNQAFDEAREKTGIILARKGLL